MILSNSKLFKFFMILFFILLCFSSGFSQTVVLTINSIEDAEKGFLVKGVVVLSNLNPGGQIVERDDCTIIVDIKKDQDSVYPVLPDYYKIMTPENVETSFLKGKKYLTRNEYNGIKILSYPLIGFSPRGFNIWRDYGGLGQWWKKAPNCVTHEFEKVIPKEYEGKTVRIRASLKHQWGGPYANWSAYSFHHDIGHEGILKANNIKKPESHKIYIAAGPAGKPNPVASGGSVQCKITGKDTQGHKLLYKWTIKPRAGSFSDPAIPNPIWTAPENTVNKKRNYTISCTITCPADSSLKQTGLFVQEVCTIIKPVSVILRFSAKGFETWELRTKSYLPKYKRLVVHGPLIPVYKNHVEAGTLRAGKRVLAELIVMSEGTEVRAERIWIEWEDLPYYGLSVDLSEFAGCTKKEKAKRRRIVRLKPTGTTDKKDKGKNDEEKYKEIYDKILADKFGKKKGFKRIWAMLGLYKAYMNDKTHIASGGADTPNLNKFFKNLKQGPVGEMKNAVNTLWEFAKSPLTLGGSAVEDMIQNTNTAWKSIFGKGFLNKPKKGSNSIKDAGIALKNKLEQLRKVLEAKK